MSKSRSMMESLLNMLFPTKPYCLLCKTRLMKSQVAVCNDCKSNIVPIVEPLCEKCGRPLGDRKSLCLDCKREKHAFVQARSYGRYQGALRLLINKFKYQKKRALAEVLGKMMFWTLEKLSWPDFDYFVPLPLHAKRQRERGFNQALLLTEVLSIESNKPIFKNIIRVKPTEHQTLLDKSFRKRNLAGAFKVLDEDKAYGKTVILIDDVYTTGATANECSKSLIKAGVKSVFVLTCARG